MRPAFDPALAERIAPTGTLRASINLGNPILARTDATTGEPAGVSVDLARELARRLGVPLALQAFGAAAKSVDAVGAGAADVGFFAIDPQRGGAIAFTPPYVLIEGAYLVRAGSALQANEAVDRAGLRVAVGRGSAYDLFLTRALSAATLERVDGADAVIEAVASGAVEVGGGIRQHLVDVVAGDPRLRLLPGRFMVIRQAMGLPRARGEAAAAALGAFVEAAKANGFVADALRRHHVTSAAVAPPGPGDDA